MMGGRFSRIFGGDEEKRGEATMLTIPYRLGRKKTQMGKSEGAGGAGGAGGGANALAGEDAEDPPSPPSIGGGGGDRPALGDTPFLAFVIRFLPEGEETTERPPGSTEGYPVPTTEKLEYFFYFRGFFLHNFAFFSSQ